MKLPLEIRFIGYRCHFLQGGECAEGHLRIVQQKTCDLLRYNHNVPVRMLWTVSKQLYLEAMPIYFQSKNFKCIRAYRASKFLDTIVPHHRQHITRMTLHLYCWDRRCLAFKKIAQCLSLKSSSLIIKPPSCPSLAIMPFRGTWTLLK